MKKIQLSVILLFVFVVLVKPVLAISMKTLKNSGGSDFKIYPNHQNDIGWETDLKNNLKLIQIGDFFLRINSIIRVISEDSPPGANFRTINFNLWPNVGYQIKRNQVFTLGWYHWSEHWYHPYFSNLWVTNINLFAIDYLYQGNNDRIYAVTGYKIGHNNYPLQSMTEIEYQHLFFQYLEPGMAINYFNFNKENLFSTDFQLAVNLGKSGYSIFAGWRAGSAPIILFQPNGFYWGFLMKW